MKTAVITGATGGIGADVAEALAKSGYAVVLHYNKNAEAAESLLQKLSKYTKTLAVQADLSDFSGAKTLFDKTTAVFGGADVLINNAGISLISPIQDVSEEDINRIINVNLISAIYLSKLFCPYMISNRFGRIINISSIWGISGASCETVYSASKAGLIGFTKALAQELAPSGVTVNAIAPGFISTPMNDTLSEKEKSEFLSSVPIGRAGTPADVSNAVLFLSSLMSGYITGQTLAVDGGLS